MGGWRVYPSRTALPQRLSPTRLVTTNDSLTQSAPLPQYRHAGKWWARFSAQVWVELDDFDKVAEAIEEICEEMR